MNVPDDCFNIIEEGFKELVGKLKRQLTKSGRDANKHDEHLEKLRKGMVNSFINEDNKDELLAWKEYIQKYTIVDVEKSLEDMEDKNLIIVTKNHIEWLKRFVKLVNKKIEGDESNIELEKRIKELEKRIDDCDKMSDAKGVVKELEDAKNKLSKRTKKRVDKNINLESTDMELAFDYLEEGLFKKKPEVEVEVMYDDWEAYCAVYELGNKEKQLKNICVDLPEEFQDKTPEEIKGQIGTSIMNYIKKETKKELKEYNVKKMYFES